MSQAKVDRYKEEKRNREKIMKKQKRDWMLMKTGLGVVAAVVLVWAGVSVYNGVTANQETLTDLPTYYVDIDAMEEYLADMSADVQ